MARLEKITKGAANRRRVAIMLLLEDKPGLSLIEIAETQRWNLKTTAEHARRLAATGLISKGRHHGSIPHKLTRRGASVLKFLKSLE